MELDLRLGTLFLHFMYSNRKTNQIAQILRLCQEGMQLREVGAACFPGQLSAVESGSEISSCQSLKKGPSSQLP